MPQVNEQDRSTYLGASEIAAACGLSPHTSRYDLWMKKTGRLADDPDNPHIRRGRACESAVRDVELPRDDRIIETRPGDWRQHPDHPFIAAHVDFYAKWQNGGGVIDVAGEIKVPQSYTYQVIREQGLPEPNTMQLMLGTGLAELDKGVFGIHNADAWETLVFACDFDQELYDWMVAKGVEFMEQHVFADEPPDPFPDMSEMPEVPKLAGEAVATTDDEWIELMEELDDYRQLEESLKAIWEGKDGEPGLKEQIDERLKDFGDAKTIIGGPRKIVRIASQGARRFNKELVAAQDLLDPGELDECLVFAAQQDMDPEETATLIRRNARIPIDDDRLYKKGEPYTYWRDYEVKEPV